MPRRLLSAAAVCTVVLGLVACGEGGKGTVTDPPSSIDISMPSDGGGAEPSDGGGDGDPTAAQDVPAPDPADYPGMDENTIEGAEQAFRYYIAVSMWSHRTGDDALLTSLEGPDCSGCADLNADLPGLKEAERGWGEYSLEDVDLESYSGDLYDHEIFYAFILSEHEEPDLETGGTKSVSATGYDLGGGMDWSDGRWVVNGLTGDWGPNVLDD